MNTATTKAHVTIDHLKRVAKRIKKADGIQYCEALEQAAQKAGFPSFAQAQRQIAARASA